MYNVLVKVSTYLISLVMLIIGVLLGHFLTLKFTSASTPACINNNLCSKATFLDNSYSKIKNGTPVSLQGKIVSIGNAPFTALAIEDVETSETYIIKGHLFEELKLQPSNILEVTGVVVSDPAYSSKVIFVDAFNFVSY